MAESWINGSNNKIAEAFKKASDKIYKRKKYSTPESLIPERSFIKDDTDKDTAIEALWQAYENHGSISDPKNYDFVKHFLNVDPDGETDEDYNNLNSVANDAFVNMVDGLYQEHLNEKDFKTLLNKENMLQKMIPFVAIPMNEVMRNIDRFKSDVQDYSFLYKESDDTIDQELLRNILFKDDIAAIKATKEEQQEAQEQQNQEDYTLDPSGDTGNSLGTGFGSMGAPYEVQPLRQAPVWLTREQEKNVANFIASRALQDYKK